MDRSLLQIAMKRAAAYMRRRSRRAALAGMFLTALTASAAWFYQSYGLWAITALQTCLNVYFVTENFTRANRYEHYADSIDAEVG